MEFSTWGDWEPVALMISGFTGSVGGNADWDSSASNDGSTRHTVAVSNTAAIKDLCLWLAV